MAQPCRGGETRAGLSSATLPRDGKSRELGEGGYDKFHEHVHKGVPGDNINDIGANDDCAFQNPNNLVAVADAVRRDLPATRGNS